MVAADFERRMEIRIGGELGMPISGEGRGEGRLDGKVVFDFFFFRVEGAFLADRAWFFEVSMGAGFLPMPSRKHFNPFPSALRGLFAHTCRALSILTALKLSGLQSSSAA